jgi:hypothetical protein
MQRTAQFEPAWGEGGQRCVAGGGCGPRGIYAHRSTLAVHSSVLDPLPWLEHLRGEVRDE